MLTRFTRLKLLRRFDDCIIKKWNILATSNVLCKKYTTNAENQSLKLLENLHKDGIKLGQPTFHSHPHILKENELAIGVTVGEFKERRQRLMEAIQEQCNKLIRPKKFMVIIPASPKKYMTEKIPYVFRQNSDFYYLTGCLEPGAILVMWTDDNGAYKTALFVHQKNKHDELWDGPRNGTNWSIHLFQVDEAFDVGSFEHVFDKFITSESYSIWFDIAANVQPTLKKKLEKSLTTTTSLHSPTILLHQQRLIKSPAEQNLMRETCRIGSEALNETMKESKPGDSEHHIFARMDYHSRMKNASFLAYPPVVAAGPNATIIHYINNSQIVQDGDLVLMDAGCEYGGYSSDITRTWPINGTFTPEQGILYEVIYDLQKDLMAVLRKHESITLDQLFDVTLLRLGNYLQEVGLIDKSLERMQLARAAFDFCPHHVSHYLGMDIHDTGLIKRDIPLTPGMVFTVEPGLYISPDRKDLPEGFRGIGIRIEDDVLYESPGNFEVLTEKCIKSKPKENYFTGTSA